jgi:hypothetical protein
MMGAGEVNIEERILMTMQEYSILKEVLEYHECGWSYNVTGICNWSSCPLANSRYVTIRDHDGE